MLRDAAALCEVAYPQSPDPSSRRIACLSAKSAPVNECTLLLLLRSSRQSSFRVYPLLSRDPAAATAYVLNGEEEKDVACENVELIAP